jgi:hypothetical protein
VRGQAEANRCCHAMRVSAPRSSPPPSAPQRLSASSSAATPCPAARYRRLPAAGPRAAAPLLPLTGRASARGEPAQQACPGEKGALRRALVCMAGLDRFPAMDRLADVVHGGSQPHGRAVVGERRSGSVQARRHRAGDVVDAREVCDQPGWCVEPGQQRLGPRRQRFPGRRRPSPVAARRRVRGRRRAGPLFPTRATPRCPATSSGRAHRGRRTRCAR